MKGASACVESVFSGVNRLLGDFGQAMSPELLELYVFIHYNWQYEFLRPSIEEVVAAYIKLHGSVPLEEDIVPELASDEEDGGEEEEGADGAAAEGPAE